jgi:diguanylate cyclase (GGDEF)-like protein
MVQGYFVQYPQTDLAELRRAYTEIHHLSRSDRRSPLTRDRALITAQMSYIKPVYADCDIITVFDAFRKELEYPFFPVINRYDEPIGIIRDNAFKDVIFSKYGRQLLENPTFGRDLNRFLTRVPMADIHSSIEKLIEQYARNDANEGLLIVDSGRYIGFLTPQALLKMINEKNLAVARNQNPLSRLPGNTLIHEYCSRALADTIATYFLVYFDFDNFKVFNDTYGFRNGDRLILMFADLLKSVSQSGSRFAGHVGGDDFFLGICDGVRDAVIAETRSLAALFRKNAESFYDKSAIDLGYVLAPDRDGVERRIPLVSVSAAILELPAFIERPCSIERAGNIMAILKKEAKHSESGISVADIQRFLPKRPATEPGHPDWFDSPGYEPVNGSSRRVPAAGAGQEVGGDANHADQTAETEIPGGGEPLLPAPAAGIHPCQGACDTKVRSHDTTDSRMRVATGIMPPLPQQQAPAGLR